MGLDRHLRKALIEDSLKKKEDPEAYAKLAREGLLLGHPVKIKGQEKRTDNGIPHHTSIKFFNKESDKPEHAHETASKLDHQTIDPKKVGIEPGKIKSRAGEDIYVIKLHGPHAEKLKEHHNKFSHMGHKENYEYHPHISVSKETHDEIKAAGHKTAHDAGIEFGHAELKRGPHTIHSYGPKVEKSEDLEKGALKNMLTAGAMAGALASASPSEAKAPTQVPLHPTTFQHSGYSRDKLLNAIAQVESSGGKNIHHKPTSMGTAYGKWAVMPDVVHDTIRLNPDLKRQYKKVLRLQGDNLNRYLQDNPKLEQEIVNRHLNRLEHHFGQNPEAISFAWNHGIVGTNRALKEKQNIANHPYVQKFKQAYERGK